MINNKTTSVSFTCTANKASYYYWLRGSDEIPSDAEFKGINNNSLVLHNILPSDSGTYQCVAVNEHGKTYSYLAKLTIKGMYVCYVVNISHIYSLITCA